MATGLPETVRVKLSSEEAGGVSITPVVVREMPLRELVELMLDMTGKDSGRIRDLLLRGTLVSGASRFRWPKMEADEGSLEALIAALPDPEPDRPFAPDRCVRVRFEWMGPLETLPREALARRRPLRRSSFWDVLVEIAADSKPRYAGYSYRDQADLYLLEIPPGHREKVKSRAALLRYSTLEAQVRQGNLRQVVFLVSRAASGS